MPGFSFMLVADDYGLSPAVSRGIFEALSAGRLSGTGAMTNRPNWPAAAAALRTAGREGRAGLHLNLTCGAPLTAMSALAPEGRFPALNPILKGARARNLPAGEVAAEIDAQLDAFTDALGRPPAYVDGHQHVHMLPQIRDILLEALVKRGWQGKVWLRDSSDTTLAILRRRIEVPKAFAVRLLGSGFANAARAAGFATNRGFSGFSAFVPEGGYARDFSRYLIAPGHRHLIMCHPGHADAELAAVDPHTKSREKELAFLLSDEFLAVLDRVGARIADI